MREYVRRQAEFHDGTFAFARLRRAFRNWLARRYLRRLEQLDDYILADIGLTRDDLTYGQRLPIEVDPIAELVRHRDTRVARGVRHK